MSARRGRVTASTVIIAAVLAAACAGPTTGGSPRSTPGPTPTTTAPAPVRAPSPFGVDVSGLARQPGTMSAIHDLGATWMRLNIELGGPQPDVAAFLDAGVNVVLTVSNKDPANAITTYGTPGKDSHGGFPFRSSDVYEQAVRAVLTPLHPALAAGRQIWVQCENEVGDASLGKSPYWRGTTDQYLTLEHACYDAAKSVDPRIPVVLSSFPSESLGAAIDASNPRHDFAVSRIERLLGDGRYDAVDLHFYGCAADIGAKVQWVDARRHAGTRWISTENSGPDPRCASTPVSWTNDLGAFEQEEAREVPQRLAACADHGGAVCLWFSLYDLKHEVDTFNHLGLLDARAVPPRPKPAYDAFKAFVASRTRP